MENIFNDINSPEFTLKLDLYSDNKEINFTILKNEERVQEVCLKKEDLIEVSAIINKLLKTKELKEKGKAGRPMLYGERTTTYSKAIPESKVKEIDTFVENLLKTYRT